MKTQTTNFQAINEFIQNAIHHTHQTSEDDELVQQELRAAREELQDLSRQFENGVISEVQYGVSCRGIAKHVYKLTF